MAEHSVRSGDHFIRRFVTHFPVQFYKISSEHCRIKSSKIARQNLYAKILYSTRIGLTGNHYSTLGD